MDALIRALPKLLSAAGDNDEVAEAVARIAWTRIAGERLCQHAVPFRLYRSTFIIAVSDGIWQKQMSALSGQLLSRLNSMLGKGTITFIEFRIDPKTVERQRATKPSAVAESAESVLSSVPEDVMTAADSIQDENLRRRFLLAAGADLLRKERAGDADNRS